MTSPQASQWTSAHKSINSNVPHPVFKRESSSGQLSVAMSGNLSGYLLKLGASDWKKRWFVFDADSGRLMYYPSQTTDVSASSTHGTSTISGNRCLGVVHMNHAVVQDGSSELEFVVLFISTGRSYTLLAQSLDEKMYWIEGLNAWKDTAAARPLSTTTTITTTRSVSYEINYVFIDDDFDHEIPDLISNQFRATTSPPPTLPSSDVVDDNVQSLSDLLRELLGYEPYMQQRSAIASADSTRQILRSRLGDNVSQEQARFLLQQMDFHIEHLHSCYQAIQTASQDTSSSKLNYSVPPPPPIDDRLDTGLLSLSKNLILYIFSFLAPTDLARTATVSQSWKVCSENNMLWARFCNSAAMMFDTAKDWKSVYVSRYSRRKSYQVPKIASLTSTAPSAPSEPEEPSWHSVKEGWLFKRGDDMLKLWKKRWFVISGTALFYFKHPTDQYPCGIIPLSNLAVIKERVPGRRNCFRLEGLSGGLGSCKQVTGVGMTANKRTNCLLGAETENECDEWVTEIKRIVARSTKDSNGSSSNVSPPPAVEEEDHTPMEPPPPRLKIFGASLAEVMNQPPQLQQSLINVPVFLSSALASLYSSIDEEGLFRVPGSVAEVTDIRDQIESGKNVDFSKHDPHAVAGVVKSFFRELREPIVPQDLNSYALTVASANHDATYPDQEKPDVIGKLNEFKFIIEQLPPINRASFEALIALMVAVAAHSARNKMNENNLLRVITPTLNCAPQLISYSMRYYDYIFNGAPYVPLPSPQTSSPSIATSFSSLHNGTFNPASIQKV